MESGILLLTHRYLDPATGRFLRRDPIGIGGGVNLYAVVGNGMVVLSDSKGMRGSPKAHRPERMPHFYCDTSGNVVGLPKTAPAYRCTQEVCLWFAREYKDIGEIAKKLCDTVRDCAETNYVFPPIPHEHPCWHEGGSEPPSWSRDWWPNLCCVECESRVCYWFETPAEQLLYSVMKSRLRRCWEQYHGR